MLICSSLGGCREINLMLRRQKLQATWVSPNLSPPIVSASPLPKHRLSPSLRNLFPRRGSWPFSPPFFFPIKGRDSAVNSAGSTWCLLPQHQKDRLPEGSLRCVNIPCCVKGQEQLLGQSREEQVWRNKKEDSMFDDWRWKTAFKPYQSPFVLQISKSIRKAHAPSLDAGGKCKPHKPHPAQGIFTLPPASGHSKS